MTGTAVTLATCELRWLLGASVTGDIIVLRLATALLGTAFACAALVAPLMRCFGLALGVISVHGNHELAADPVERDVPDGLARDLLKQRMRSFSRA